MCVGVGLSVLPIETEIGTWAFSNVRAAVCSFPWFLAPNASKSYRIAWGKVFVKVFGFLAGLSEIALPLLDHFEPCDAERIGSFSCSPEKLFRRFLVGEFFAAVGVTFLAPVEKEDVEFENCFAGGMKSVNRGALNPSFSSVHTLCVMYVAARFVFAPVGGLDTDGFVREEGLLEMCFRSFYLLVLTEEARLPFGANQTVSLEVAGLCKSRAAVFRCL